MAVALANDNDQSIDGRQVNVLPWCVLVKYGEFGYFILLVLDTNNIGLSCIPRI